MSRHLLLAGIVLLAPLAIVQGGPSPPKPRCPVGSPVANCTRSPCNTAPCKLKAKTGGLQCETNYCGARCSCKYCLAAQQRCGASALPTHAGTPCCSGLACQPQNLANGTTLYTCGACKSAPSLHIGGFPAMCESSAECCPGFACGDYWLGDDFLTRACKNPRCREQMGPCDPKAKSGPSRCCAGLRCSSIPVGPGPIVNGSLPRDWRCVPPPCQVASRPCGAFRKCCGGLVCRGPEGPLTGDKAAARTCQDCLKPPYKATPPWCASNSDCCPGFVCGMYHIADDIVINTCKDPTCMERFRSCDPNNASDKCCSGLTCKQFTGGIAPFPRWVCL